MREPFEQMQETKTKYSLNSTIEKYKKLEQLRDEAKRRLGKMKLELYEPHPGQKKFHEAKEKIRICLTGNRWGKTEALVAEALSYAIGYRPWDGTKTRTPPNKILICVPTFSAILEYIVPKFDRLEPEGLRLSGREGVRYLHSSIPGSYHYRNGSMIAFGSYQQEIAHFQGRDWDAVFLDETCPKEIFDILMMRVVDRKGRIHMTLTPENMGAAWIFDDLYSMAGEDIDIFQITGTSYDNPHIPHDELKNTEARLSPEEREAKIYGRFKHLMGRVFPEYDKDIHCLDLSSIKGLEELPKGVVIDPHDRKPFAMAWFAVTPQNDIIFLEEWPDDNFLDHKIPHSFEEYVRVIQAIEERLPGGQGTIQWRLMDPNFGRSKKAISGRSVEEEFEMYGLYFDTRIEDDVTTGHLSIRKRLAYDKAIPKSELNRPHLYFRNGLQNFHKSFLNYIYDHRKMEEDKGVTERPKEKYKDFIDLVRYTCMFDPMWLDPREFEQQSFKALDRLRSARIYH